MSTGAFTSVSQRPSIQNSIEYAVILLGSFTNHTLSLGA